MYGYPDEKKNTKDHMRRSKVISNAESTLGCRQPVMASKVL